MTWFKVDDTSAFNAKVMAAGNEAWGAFCRVGAWCAQQLSDGKFSRAIALNIAPMRVWEKLSVVGLVDRLENGEMQMHDYLQRNPSKAEILADREAAKERMKRVRSLSVRANNLRTLAEVPDGMGEREDLISDPESQTVQVTSASAARAEPVFAELWESKYKRPHVWDGNTGPRGAASQLIGVWKRAATYGEPEPIFRHWVKGYLRDSEAWVTERNHPAIGLASRVNRYGFPRKGPIIEEPEPVADKGLDPEEQGRRAREFLSKAKIGSGGNAA